MTAEAQETGQTITGDEAAAHQRRLDRTEIALAVLLRIDGLPNLALLGGAHVALATVLLAGLAWHLHFLNREQRRQAIIEALIDALSTPASIEATAEATRFFAITAPRTSVPGERCQLHSLAGRPPTSERASTASS